MIDMEAVDLAYIRPDLELLTLIIFNISSHASEEFLTFVIFCNLIYIWLEKNRCDVWNGWLSFSR